MYKNLKTLFNPIYLFLSRRILNKSNLNKLLIIFIIGLIFRIFINTIYNINHFSVIFLFFSLFITIIHEILDYFHSDFTQVMHGPSKLPASIAKPEISIISEMKSSEERRFNVKPISNSLGNTDKNFVQQRQYFLDEQYKIYKEKLKAQQIVTVEKQHEETIKWIQEQQQIAAIERQHEETIKWIQEKGVLQRERQQTLDFLERLQNEVDLQRQRQQTLENVKKIQSCEENIEKLQNEVDLQRERREVIDREQEELDKELIELEQICDERRRRIR
jgi:hypothetical protein